jgi:menaquinone-9 beta-reductase
MKPYDYDLIIVGAGVAGASSAILLGRQGYRVLLLDRATFPRHKTCGEGIMPEGVRILDELGVLGQVREQSGPPIRGLRFRNRAGVWAQADFPPVGNEPAYSVVIRRYELDHILIQQAKSLATVTAQEGFVVTGALWEDDGIRGVTGHRADQPERSVSFRAPITLAADGAHSRFHNRYGIRREYRKRQRWGIAGHLRGVEDLKPYIEVLFQKGSEIYVAPLAGDTALVAILVEKEGMRAFRGELARNYHDFLRTAPGLGARIEHSEVMPPVGASGPLGFSVAPVFLPGLLLIGDSAGFVDAITGEGMTLALKSAQVAVPAIQRAFDAGDFSGALEQYAADRARVIEDAVKLTEVILRFSRVGWLADRAIRRLSRDQALFQKLIGTVTGTSRYRDFTIWDRLALGGG